MDGWMMAQLRLTFDKALCLVLSGGGGTDIDDNDDDDE